jgi:hypothetical protein
MKRTVVTLAALVLLAISGAHAETEHITIGQLIYRGTATYSYTDQYGILHTIPGVSTYQLPFTTDGVTAQPITFKAKVFVKGSILSLDTFNTGPVCGQEPTGPECEWLFFGANASGFKLAPCARTDNVTQTCVSIAVQLLSPTGNNFPITLADGETFCVYAVNTTYVTVKQGQAALDPQCDALGFCKGASAPIVLHRAPHGC